MNKILLQQEGLIVLVVGASGDLAKKKTYPSLIKLYESGLLPENTEIWGYARSSKTSESFREQLAPLLLKEIDSPSKENIVNSFLSKCFYHSGSSYGDLSAYQSLVAKMEQFESKLPPTISRVNRLFYFAIPPNIFSECAVAIKRVCITPKGWNRIIVEKPFGRDLDSSEKLSNVLSKHFQENQLYRIDHYLGKEMVQNLLVMRFGNSWLEWFWNRNAISSVMIEFKEPFGTDGRGGYFDNYGIIRDVIQNHLLQVLTLVAMECPSEIEGIDAGESIREAKVNVLNSIPPIQKEDCVLGQYEGYTSDPSIKNKGTTTATYAAVRCFVNTPRWKGVPFFITAGKALDERKVEIRLRLKDAPGTNEAFSGSKYPKNELVIQLQPKESIFMKTNVKSPGFNFVPIQSSLDLKYHSAFNMSKTNNPGAYTRLILDALRGRHGSFVRGDELKRSWEIFTPILHHIEKENIKPFTYKQGSQGPQEALQWMKKSTNTDKSTKIEGRNINIIRPNLEIRKMSSL